MHYRQHKFVLSLYLSVVLVCSAQGQAPVSHFSFVADLGTNYLLNQYSENAKVGRCGSVGINFMAVRPKSTFHFLPGLHFNVSGYRSGLNGSSVRVNQASVRLRLEAIFRPGKRKMYLRAGIFIDRLTDSFVSVVTRSANSNVGVSNPYIADDFYPSPVQAGIIAGLSWPVKMFGREQLFMLSCLQHVSRIVDDHYRMNTASTIVSVSARPVALTAGVAIALNKEKKVKAVTGSEE
jgi:hypothetical protein